MISAPFSMPAWAAGQDLDLAKLIKINKPTVRVTYELQEIGTPTLEDVLKKF